MRDPSPHGEWANICPECGLYTWHCICRDTGWEDVEGWDEGEEHRENRWPFSDMRMDESRFYEEES